MGLWYVLRCRDGKLRADFVYRLVDVVRYTNIDLEPSVAGESDGGCYDEQTRVLDDGDPLS